VIAVTSFADFGFDGSGAFSTGTHEIVNSCECEGVGGASMFQLCRPAASPYSCLSFWRFRWQRRSKGRLPGSWAGRPKDSRRVWSRPVRETLDEDATHPASRRFCSGG
jgi:hypothetical protein